MGLMWYSHSLLAHTLYKPTFIHCCITNHLDITNATTQGCGILGIQRITLGSVMKRTMSSSCIPSHIRMDFAALINWRANRNLIYNVIYTKHNETRLFLNICDLILRLWLILVDCEWGIDGCPLVCLKLQLSFN